MLCSSLYTNARQDEGISTDRVMLMRPLLSCRNSRLQLSYKSNFLS